MKSSNTLFVQKFDNAPWHQPRVAVGGIAVLNSARMKGVVTVGQCMLEIVASRKSLDSKNVIEVQALVTGNSVGCG
jgi:hypothetical protein